MLGIVYMILSYFVGYNLLEKFLPGLFNISKVKSLTGKRFRLNKRMVILPASFLTGTLLMTWVTYISAYVFHRLQNPMFYGNLISLSVFVAASVYFIVSKKEKYAQIIKNIKTLNAKKCLALFKENRIEIIFVLAVLAVWSFFMFRSFYIKDGTMHIGLSVFSDFAPHLAVIRSFSLGSNFPTEYPHFADGTIRYHFLFQFLTGNLEYLGLRLDWAFNLPSILSILSFLMLLYSFVVITMEKKWIGIIASILFFFRSSFAFFTYIKDMSSANEVLTRIFNNDLHIGNTLHEEWGLWAQKVYVNQRHLPFALGILMLVLIAVFPLFKRMLVSKYGLREFLFKRDAWMPKDIKRSLALGIILGLLSFWNGAVVVAALPILFIIAIFSKRRLEFLNIAIIATILSFIQTAFFVGSGNPAVSPRLTVGFLSGSREITGILRYYVELLGIMPFIMIISLFTASKKWRWLASIILVPISVFAIIKLYPDFAVQYKYIIGIMILLSIATIFFYKFKTVPKGSLRLALAFFTPIILATTLQLTPDVTVNHKYVILSVILLNIFIAGFLYYLYTSKRITAILLAAVLTVTMTITGVADIITLYNLDKRAIEIKTDDPLLVWAADNTGPNEIFLTHMYSLHPLLLGGRKIFSGWPYYPWSAGYDTGARGRIINQIYGGKNIEKVKELIEENNISYIVIEDDNRNSQDYKLNEDLFKDNFKRVYESNGGRYAIYRTY